MRRLPPNRPSTILFGLLLASAPTASADLLLLAYSMLGWFLPALGLAGQQYPSIALQPSVTLEGTMSSAQEPLETDVWADPAPGPKSLSMSTTGPGIQAMYVTGSSRYCVVCARDWPR